MSRYLVIPANKPQASLGLPQREISGLLCQTRDLSCNDRHSQVLLHVIRHFWCGETDIRGIPNGGASKEASMIDLVDASLFATAYSRKHSRINALGHVNLLARWTVGALMSWNWAIDSLPPTLRIVQKERRVDHVSGRCHGESLSSKRESRQPGTFAVDSWKRECMERHTP